MIQTVAEISKATAEGIDGVEYSEDISFNPFQDADDNYIITLQEAQYLDKAVHNFSIIKFKPKINNENINLLQ